MGKGFDLNAFQAEDDEEEEEQEEQEEHHSEDQDQEQEQDEGSSWQNSGQPVVKLDLDESDQSDSSEDSDDAAAEFEAAIDGGEGGGEETSAQHGQEQEHEDDDAVAADLETELENTGEEDTGQRLDAYDAQEGYDGEMIDEDGEEEKAESSSRSSSGGSDYNAAAGEDDQEEVSTSPQANPTPADQRAPEPPPKRRVIVKKRPAGSTQKLPPPPPRGPGTGTAEHSGQWTGGASVADVANHYSQRENQRKDVRESSPIIHLKKLNNWIKSVLIRRYTREGDAVLDLACGKGGDLIKWDFARIGFYLGVDVARGSIYDAAARYNGDSTGDSGMPSRQFCFPAKLVCADCFGIDLYQELAEFGPFDVCSCQFALHYCFQSEDRARLALSNVSNLLAPGAYFIGTIPDANVIVQKLRKSPGLKFGNLVYSIEFLPQFDSKKFSKNNPFGIEYLFNLEDAVACPEWLIPFPALQALAEEYDLELVERMNFHDFIHHYVSQEELAQIMRRVVGRAWHTTVTPDEWDAAYLYCAFVFKKKGDKDSQGKRKREGKFQRIEDDDIMFLGGSDAS